VQDAGIIMVLGSPNDARGALGSVAVARCERAAALAHDNPGWNVLLTGGYGAHFNTTQKPHAHYLKEYLTRRGVPSERILAFAESRNTVEDATLSRPIVVAHGARVVAVITSDYHVARARYVFNREFSDVAVCMLFVGVPTDEARCEFDLARQKQHERDALNALMQRALT
jgi:uncharacterized SAM-binding protein YcdF (DUF218 family)